MTDKISYFFIFLILILPVSLISGPAIPDITITLTGIFFLFYIFINQKLKEVFKNKFVILSFIFWFYLIFLSLFAINIELSISDAVIFIRILMIPIFLYYLIFNNEKYLRLVFKIIFYTVIFVSLDSVYQFNNYEPEFGFGKDIFGFTSNWYGRLTGPFYQELIPGAYVSKFGLIGLLYLLTANKQNVRNSLVCISYLSLIGIVTFISGERMALATYILGISFLAIFYYEKRSIFIFSIAITFFCICIIYKNHQSYNDFKIIKSTPYHLGLEIEKEFSCDNKSVKCKKLIKLQPTFIEIIKNFNESAYGQIYNLGWSMFKDHKITGIGLNNFTYACNNDKRYKNKLLNYSCVSHPHNIYLQWLVETGLVGFIIFIFYLLSVIFSIIKYNYYKYSLIALASILIVFWPLMSTGSLIKNWNGISTFLIIGICLSINKLNKKV